MIRSIGEQVMLACCSMLLAVTAGCGGSDDSSDGSGGAPPIGCAAPQADYDPVIVAADFTSTIDNPLNPLVPGTTFNWKDADGNLITIAVTTDKKTVLGVECVVVRDTAKADNGDTLEDTYDWYAQNKDGTIWYFGEDTTAYSGTKTSKMGSWEAGVNCAKPGIIIQGAPKVGDSYRQEYLAGSAEDQSKVESVGEAVGVPAGSYTGCVKTRDFSELEPGHDEFKWFCPNVGQVAAEDIADGKREELQSITPP